MPQSVKISDDLIQSAKMVSKVEHRSLAGQVEYWACIGRSAEENPDLPFSVIREILLARAEVEAGLTVEYVFGEGQ